MKERAHGRLLCEPLDIEDPPCRRFCCREADFALQRLVECRAFEPELVVGLVVLRWQSSGIEVRRSLAVCGVCRERRRKNSPCMREEVVIMAGRKELFCLSACCCRYLLILRCAARRRGASKSCVFRCGQPCGREPGDGVVRDTEAALVVRLV